MEKITGKNPQWGRRQGRIFFPATKNGAKGGRDVNGESGTGNMPVPNPLHYHPTVCTPGHYASGVVQI